MVYINGNWEVCNDLSDISRIVREYYNCELADEIDILCPQCTKEEYEDLVSYSNAFENERERLLDKCFELENQLAELTLER
jgi:hypothetical protein